MPAVKILSILFFAYAMDFAYLCKYCNVQFNNLKEFESHAHMHQAEGLVTKARIVCLRCHRDYEKTKGFRGEEKTDIN